MYDAGPKFKVAAVAGAWLVAACVLIMAYPILDKISSSNPVRFLIFVTPLLTFLIALILHIHGYGLLGKKYNSPLLTRSAYVLIGEVVLLGILLVARIPAPLSPNPFMSTYIDAATGLLMLLFIVPVLLFALAVGRLYKTLGLVWTASAAAIIPLAVIFTWTPWPVALVGAISTYFFYKQTGYDF